VSLNDDYARDDLVGRCPRVAASEHPRCSHDAAHHGADGACSECDPETTGPLRCDLPETDEDPIRVYADADVIVETYGGGRLVCGRIAGIEPGIVVLDAIDRPAHFAQNGGTIMREHIRRIMWLRDEWRNPRFKAWLWPLI
jgi:hypothetical protein